MGSRHSEYTIKKGFHASTPFGFKPLIRSVQGNAYFDKAFASYELIPANEQGDWNKLTGITFNPLVRNSNAIMIGWRYFEGKFQFCPYFNYDGGKIIFPKPEEIITFKGDSGNLYFSVDYNKIRIKSDQQEVITMVPSQVKPNYLTSSRVQPWFGGNMAAPKDIKIMLWI